jgi:hypothetical protein
LLLNAFRSFFVCASGGKAEGVAEGKKQEREKWQGLVAEKDAIIEELRTQLNEE